MVIEFSFNSRERIEKITEFQKYELLYNEYVTVLIFYIGDPIKSICLTSLMCTIEGASKIMPIYVYYPIKQCRCS